MVSLLLVSILISASKERQLIPDRLGVQGEFTLSLESQPAPLNLSLIARREEGDLLSRIYEAPDRATISVRVSSGRHLLGLDPGESAQSDSAVYGRSWSGVPVGEKCTVSADRLPVDILLCGIRGLMVRVVKSYRRTPYGKAPLPGPASPLVAPGTQFLPEPKRDRKADRLFMEGIARNLCAQLYGVDHPESAAVKGGYCDLALLPLPKGTSARYDELNGTIVVRDGKRKVVLPVGSRRSLDKQDPGTILAYFDDAGHLQVWQPAVSDALIELAKKP